MTNPTTPFSWQMPTASDLVTDLPADFETFGQAVATSMADLLGGTTGQILSKASNTDMDFTWITNDVGDITAVTAGTGISGGGTSGAVTITNSMATEITAAGDIIVGTGSATFDNLPIGTTGQVLTADTTVSPYKVKWATPASGSTFVGAAANRTSGSQAIASGTQTAVTLPTEAYDTDGFHDTSTNTSRLTIPTGKGGKYHFECNLTFSAFIGADLYVSIRKNGTGVGEGLDSGYLGIKFTSDLQISGSVDLSAVAGDYFEMFVYQSSSGNSRNIVAARFSCSYLGA